MDKVWIIKYFGMDLGSIYCEDKMKITSPFWLKHHLPRVA